MKKIANGLFITLSSIIAIVSLAFIFIEGRLVLSFDWSLHEHEFLGFIQYLARLGLGVLCLSVSVSSIIYINRKSFVFEALCILAISMAIATGATNGIGIYFIIASALYVIASVLHHVELKKAKEE
jgi:hypothetical protein